MQTLRAFEAAARHENYSAAAQELGVTHGAISHRIRELEEQFGVTLFRRQGRAMLPSREAVTLLAQVREALNLLERAVPAASGASATSDRVVVGVHPSLATRWLVPRLGRFLARVPDATVEVRSTADLGDFLAQGVDVAIRYGAGEWPNAARERLSGEVMFPVCTPAYRDAHGLRKPADLARCTLLRHSWQQWGPWMRAARLRAREPSRGLVVSDSAMLLEAALAGQGVALARSLFAADDLRAGRLVRLFDVTIDDAWSYYLLWPASSTLSGLARAFRDWLRDELAAAGGSAAPPAPGRTGTAAAGSR
jgi:LysR family transcriptional regulator, glycine cleavage system transcriptional activator